MGIDVGTQSVRTMVVAADGTVLGTGSHQLRSTRYVGRHEQDAGEWWAAVAAASRHAMNAAGLVALCGVAVDATSGTIVLVNDAGEPITAGIMYDDTRGRNRVDAANREGSALWSQLGYQRMQASWALPKLIELLHDDPLHRDNAVVAHQSDFINARLTGHRTATDLSNALKTGVDLLRESWPLGFLDNLGVPSRMLPEVVRSGTVLGSVCASASQVTGIPTGTPVVAGMTDGCAAQLGSGATEVGSWNSVLGTTLVVKGVTDALVIDPCGVVYSHRAPDGRWLPGGASSTGAGMIAREFPAGDLAELERTANLYRNSECVTYPVGQSGERFPFVAPDAHTFATSEPSDEAERYASILLGVAFVERLCFDYLNHLGAPTDGRLVLTGGATKNMYWNQLRSDVLQRPVFLPENAEPALGMAVLAASVGRSSAEVGGNMIRVRSVIDPQRGSANRFDDRYLDFIDRLTSSGWLDSASARQAYRRTKQ
jgi:D-ribulokinase